MLVRHILLLMPLLLSGMAQAGQFQARAVIRAVDRAVLSAELAGRIIDLPARPGDSFKKGDRLVALDCDLYQAQADKVAAEHEAAGVKRDNARQLNQLRSIGELEVALARSEYQQTEAALRIARLNTRRCAIRAPYAGRVVALRVNRFENVSPQQELIEIVDDQRLEAEVVAPATWLRWLEPGTPLRLRIDETGAELTAAVSAVTPAIDAVSQTVLLRAKITDTTRLIPGMSATADFDPPAAQ